MISKCDGNLLKTVLKLLYEDKKEKPFCKPIANFLLPCKKDFFVTTQ